MNTNTKIVIDSAINDLKNMKVYTKDHNDIANGAIALCITKLVILKEELEETEGFELTETEKFLILECLSYSKFYRGLNDEETKTIVNLKKRLIESI